MRKHLTIIALVLISTMLLMDKVYAEFNWGGISGTISVKEAGDKNSKFKDGDIVWPGEDESLLKEIHELNAETGEYTNLLVRLEAPSEYEVTWARFSLTNSHGTYNYDFWDSVAKKNNGDIVLNINLKADKTAEDTKIKLTMRSAVRNSFYGICIFNEVDDLKNLLKLFYDSDSVQAEAEKNCAAKYPEKEVVDQYDISIAKKLAEASTKEEASKIVNESVESVETTTTTITTEKTTIKVGESQRLQCDEGDVSLREFVNKYWKYVILSAPILLIILITVDFIKAVFSGKDDAIKKASSDAIKRTVAAILLLMLPLILNTIFTLLGIEFCM